MIPITRAHDIKARWCGAVLSTAAVGLLFAGGGGALGQAKPKAARLPAALAIFRGDSLQTSGLTLANWGSGSVEEDTGKILSGTESIRLTTHGMYQGGSLNFNKPVNLGPYLAGKFNYLTVVVQLPNTNPNAGGGDSGFQGFSGFGKGALGPGGFAGGAAGVASPGGGQNSGGPGGGRVQAQKGRKLENLRLVMATTGGKTIETLLPVAGAVEENQWKTLAIPLSQIPALTADDAQIQSIRIFGDAPATLNIGSIGVVEDSSPIVLEPINGKTVQRLARYQYIATASAGITPLVYSWDWDASDGIQDETEGRNVTHTFRKASVDDAGRTTDFTVTVTVSDLYHLKAPAKTTFKVHVTP